MAEAARVLGLTEQALRKRLARGTMEARKNNRGALVVLVSNAGVARAQPALSAQDIPSTTGQGGVHNTAPPASADAPETVPLSMHRETVDALQRASGEALAAVQAQHRELVEYLRSEHRDDRARQGRWYEEKIERLRAEADQRVDRVRIEADRKVDAAREKMHADRAWFTAFMVVALLVLMLLAPWRH